MLGGVEDLLEGLADLCAVGVGERLDAAGSLPDLEGIDVDLDGHRGVRRDGGVDPGVTMPAGDLDGEIVAALAPSPVRVVLTRSRPDSGPSLWAPAMLMASGYADARSPPLRPAEATITWRSRRHMW
jgi:hypothetical protein